MRHPTADHQHATNRPNSLPNSRLHSAALSPPFLFTGGARNEIKPFKTQKKAICIRLDRTRTLKTPSTRDVLTYGTDIVPARRILGHRAPDVSDQAETTSSTPLLHGDQDMNAARTILCLAVIGVLLLCSVRTL
jgi:hypothetical protein